MLKKIISGGQTGVDQAGLLVATEMGIAVGGWCPKGGLDENGDCILDKYPLKEAATASLDERTKLNIQDSDGTLIIVPTWPLPKKIKDGTKSTIKYAEALKKSHLIIKLDDKGNAVDILMEWINEFNIKVLNIAGPRESTSPGINKESCELLHEMFAALV